MKRLVTLVGCLVGVVACAPGKGAEHVPALAVDHEGVAGRMTAVSPPEESEQTGSAKPGAEEGPAAPPAAAPPEERVLHETPEKPSPTQSGDRVTFRTVEASEKKEGSQQVRLPGRDLNSERDPRRGEFEKRHEGRMRQVARPDKD